MTRLAFYVLKNRIMEMREFNKETECLLFIENINAFDRVNHQ
jgi:hypothetical protein